MKAIVLREFGGPDQLQVEEVEQPVPGKGQVLIQVKVIGINPVDTKVRAGTNRAAKNLRLPAIIGWDVSGVIAGFGEGVEGVSDYKKGDAVFGCIGFPGAGGAYAAYAVADIQELTPKPAEISFEEAAALPIAGLTAYQAINEQLAIHSRQKLLLQSAAGGVGHLALQFAKLNDGYVLGTASEKNRAFLKELGIDEMIDYKNEKFEDYAHDVDAVLDTMGGAILLRSIGCTRKEGAVVCLPSSTRDDPKAVALAKEKEISLTWPMMHIDNSQLRHIGELLAAKKLRINIDKVFPFDEMSKAHEAIETHATRGKVVVKGIE